MRPPRHSHSFCLHYLMKSELLQSFLEKPLRTDLLFPFPEIEATELAVCHTVLTAIRETSWSHMNPQMQAEQCFKMGLMGLCAPVASGGKGLSTASLSCILTELGAQQPHLARMVAKHAIFGLQLLTQFGSERLKAICLPKLATEASAVFCLNEARDAHGNLGPHTQIRLTEDGRSYILDGEKTSVMPVSVPIGMVIVLGKQIFPDGSEGLTAVCVDPQASGVHVKPQSSETAVQSVTIQFENVTIPRDQLMHQEGKGLELAQKALQQEYLALSAIYLGIAQKTTQSVLTAATARQQFGHPITDYELVRKRIARMSAYQLGMTSVLQFTSGLKSEQSGLEATACKVICSELAHRIWEDAETIQGARDMTAPLSTCSDHPLRALAEYPDEMLLLNVFAHIQPAKSALRYRPGMVLGLRPVQPSFSGLHPALRQLAAHLAKSISEQAFQFQKICLVHRDALASRQFVQVSLAKNLLWLYTLATGLSRMDAQIRKGESGASFDRDQAALAHLMDLLTMEMEDQITALQRQADASMLKAAHSSLQTLHTSAPHSSAIASLPPENPVPTPAPLPDPPIELQLSASDALPDANFTQPEPLTEHVLPDAVPADFESVSVEASNVERVAEIASFLSEKPVDPPALVNVVQDWTALPLPHAQAETPAQTSTDLFRPVTLDAPLEPPAATPTPAFLSPISWEPSRFHHSSPAEVPTELDILVPEIPHIETSTPDTEPPKPHFEVPEWD